MRDVLDTSTLHLPDTRPRISGRRAIRIGSFTGKAVRFRPPHAGGPAKLPNNQMSLAETSSRPRPTPWRAPVGSAWWELCQDSPNDSNATRTRPAQKNAVSAPHQDSDHAAQQRGKQQRSDSQQRKQPVDDADFDIGPEVANRLMLVRSRGNSQPMWACHAKAADSLKSMCAGPARSGHIRVGAGHRERPGRGRPNVAGTPAV